MYQPLLRMMWRHDSGFKHIVMVVPGKIKSEEKKLSPEKPRKARVLAKTLLFFPQLEKIDVTHPDGLHVQFKMEELSHSGERARIHELVVWIDDIFLLDLLLSFELRTEAPASKVASRLYAFTFTFTFTCTFTFIHAPQST
jgi:hypothetical protein